MAARHSLETALLAYEWPLAPCGGISAVLGFLPGELQAASGRPVGVLVPWHRHCTRETVTAAEVTVVGRVEVVCESRPLKVDVCRYRSERYGWNWYLLRPEREDIFAGERHPYDLAAAAQTRDALAFGAAAATALRAVPELRASRVQLHDWHAATAALYLADDPALPASTRQLVLHNTYDSLPLNENWLRSSGVPPAALRSWGDDEASVLKRSLRLVAPLVCSVSEQFARELLEDELQRSVIAPHLQPQLSVPERGATVGRLRGVDNGLFIRPSVDLDALRQARQGWPDALRGRKQEAREQALQHLLALKPDGTDSTPPVWGDRQAFAKAHGEQTVWFFMSGRDDPGQKGYDVAAAAAEQLLAGEVDAQFLFLPIFGDQGLESLTFLQALAAAQPGRVLVIPSPPRLPQGYPEAMAGADFGLVPSLYEPFGMTNEYYLSGTAVVGRATGGTLLQVVPLRSAAAYSLAVEDRARNYYGTTAAPTGILYREPDALANAEAWHALKWSELRFGEPCASRLDKRCDQPLFRAMAEELEFALRDALRVAQNPELYGRMVAAGYDHITGSFSWAKAARRYWSLLR